MDESKYLSVSALNKYLYYKFDNDLNLRNVYLKAEISNVRLSKGILYFVLKDNESEIDGLMFNNVYTNLKFDVQDGMTVLVQGQVSIYPKRGTYSIKVISMEQVGLGEAYLNFLLLKDKLMNEGLFDEDKKKPLPKFPKIIGLITSGTGDAMHDVISTIDKRYPLAQIHLYPSLVQGDEAPLSIINSIKKANKDGDCDCLIIARGGGSLEDLACFNDEMLARTIFESNIPIISGVGHEADFTICDFVASRRAPTPTGAAVMATPNIVDLINDLINKKQKLATFIKNKLIDSFNKYNYLIQNPNFANFNKYLNNYNIKLDAKIAKLNSLSPINRIDNLIDKVNHEAYLLNKNYNSFIEYKNNEFNNLINKMIILNPLNIMNKGYSLTYQDDKLIKSVDDVDINKELRTELIDGTIISGNLKKINKQI
ncbi:MAG: exodeoxyribonuclease VII large subunit [Bacilli bacterium]|nr:exodeoxyribonuclease VII large subunit [Bacilli bacterium]